MFSGKFWLKGVKRGERGCLVFSRRCPFFALALVLVVSLSTGYAKASEESSQVALSSSSVSPEVSSEVSSTASSEASGDEPIVVGLKRKADIFPIYSDVYGGGVQFDSSGKLYIWDGQTKMESSRQDVPGGKNALRVIPAPSGEWFGWGIHPFPKKYVNMLGFTNGRMSLYLKATSNATVLKIGVKNVASAESWVEIAPGAYGFQYDNKWHALSIPFKDFIPKINFRMINVYFMFVARDRIRFGSQYEIDEIYWEK